MLFRSIESESNFHLIIANSNIEHSTDTVVKKVKKFRNENEEKFSELCSNETKLVEEVLELLKENNITELGQKINLNQEFLEVIGVSNEKLRDMIQVGQKSSLGAKITGAGGGGCIFALTDEKNLNNTMNQFKEKNYECFSVKIDLRGLNTF